MPNVTDVAVRALGLGEPPGELVVTLSPPPHARLKGESGTHPLRQIISTRNAIYNTHTHGQISEVLENYWIIPDILR